MSRSHDHGLKLALALALAAMTGLSACGKQGPLERPAPLFGSRARAEFEAEKAQEARDDAQRRAQASGQAPAVENENSQREVRDPNQRLAPASTAPLPGAPNPLGGPPSATAR